MLIVEIENELLKHGKIAREKPCDSDIMGPEGRYGYKMNQWIRS